MSTIKLVACYMRVQLVLSCSAAAAADAHPDVALVIACCCHAAIWREGQAVQALLVRALYCFYLLSMTQVARNQLAIRSCCDSCPSRLNSCPGNGNMTFSVPAGQL